MTNTTTTEPASYYRWVFWIDVQRRAAEIRRRRDQREREERQA